MVTESTSQWPGPPGLVPLPAQALEGFEAQFDPETESVPTGSHLLGREVGEDDPGLLLLDVPDHQEGATAFGGGGAESGALADPRGVGLGNEGEGGKPVAALGAEGDVFSIPHTGMPALGSYLFPQLRFFAEQITVISLGTAGASFERTVGSMPRWVRMRQAGMAERAR